MNYWLFYFLFLILGGGGLIALVIYLFRRNRAPLVNITLTALALFITLMGVEFYFKVFFAQPDALPTLAVQNWYQRYYEGTINSLGYRDIEWTPAMVQGKTKVMVVGDSFVEGVGIEQPQDRFPDRLAHQLGPNYAVFNLGKRRANTTDEIQAILHYPYKPDTLVLSYFVNDIDNIRWWYNVDRTTGPSVSPLLAPLVDNSYAFNFLSWRWYRLAQATQPDTEWLHLLKLYNDPEAWWTHQHDLLSIYEGARSEKIPFLVVVFPSMNHTEESKVIAERVIDLFETKGVPVLNVIDLIEGIPTNELVASPVDPHPSEWVHEQVAQALYEMLIELEIVESDETY